MIVKRTANLILIGTAAIYHSRITIKDLINQVRSLRDVQGEEQHKLLIDIEESLVTLSDNLRKGNTGLNHSTLSEAFRMAKMAHLLLWILILWSVVVTIFWLAG